MAGHPHGPKIHAGQTLGVRELNGSNLSSAAAFLIEVPRGFLQIFHSNAANFFQNLLFTTTNHSIHADSVTVKSIIFFSLSLSLLRIAI
jgi:hypothetical protein